MGQVEEIKQSNPVFCPVCDAPSRYEFSGRDLMFDHHERFDYYICNSCSVIFQHPIPDLERIETFYPESYSVFSPEHRQRNIGKLRLALLQKFHGYKHLNVNFSYRILAIFAGLFRKLNTPHWDGGGKMLDVGCGNGRFMVSMKLLGWDVQGVELSENGVRSCQMSNLVVHHGDLFSAKFPEAFFDLVTVRHVIEHVPYPSRFMAELGRILRPGGRLVVETPNSEALGRRWFDTRWYANDVPRHLFLFSLENLKKLANRHGLSLSDITWSTTPKIFLNSLDYINLSHHNPSKYSAWRRALSRIYIWIAKRARKEDTMQLIFLKR